jgi:hypothetical protein
MGLLAITFGYQLVLHDFWKMAFEENLDHPLT